MSGIYEVYDDEKVQLLTRRKAGVTFAVLIASVASSVVLVVLTREGIIGSWLSLCLQGAIWSYAALRLTRHVQRTNHVVWCVKMSPAQVIGYDYARRKTAISWCDVRRIEVGDSGIVVQGPPDRRLEIPHLFPDFPALSHRIVDHAEAHRIPLTIEGRDLDALDIHDLYPFLAPDRSESGSRGGSLRV